MKKQLNEIKRMQQLAGILIENIEPDFDEKVLNFLNKNKKLIAQAIKFYQKQGAEYEESLIGTIYDFFNKYIGEDWTKQISTPSPEDEKIYTHGWSDDKDERFYEILKNFINK